MIEFRFKCVGCQNDIWVPPGTMEMVNGRPVCSDECGKIASEMSAPEPQPTRHQFRGQTINKEQE